ncbi:MAG: Holliday junction branch migration protein RuvA [Flavobacteriales bacterium]|jgi:Holliday junction DNA helicase RuvA|nr:MAG: Holliday junction branch migration protein RuvA [Flavobacteriales bacterium]|tara:strand:+ start:1254 stop:1835 length:582 start_codon:yes stop_codon:yes gene_type:complete
MITQLNGRLVSKTPTTLVIDCGGVGYEVHISLHTFGQLPEDEHIRIYTHHQVREDAQTLYGFIAHVERSVFRLLLSVSGIGANTARTMLSSMTPHDVVQAIQSDNVAAIQSVKGIGAKTAQRVIVDLSDKVTGLLDEGEISTTSNNTQRDEALSALSVLGYPMKQTQKVVDTLLQAEPNMPVERIIKNALNKL